jgi:hypothetical protein
MLPSDPKYGQVVHAARALEWSDDGFQALGVGHSCRALVVQTVE